MLRVPPAREPDLHAHLEDLARAFDVPQRAPALRAMFCTRGAHVPVASAEFQRELAFSLWGFARHDHARHQLLCVLLCCLQPRVYMAAETLAGHHVELLMVVKLDRLCLARERFEDWLGAFLAELAMSAGVLVFQDYLGEQMLASIQRIQAGQKLRSNLRAEANKDFRLLCSTLQQLAADAARVRQFTRLELSADNFIDLFVTDMLRRDGAIGPRAELRRIAAPPRRPAHG